MIITQICIKSIIGKIILAYMDSPLIYFPLIWLIGNNPTNNHTLTNTHTHTHTQTDKHTLAHTQSHNPQKNMHTHKYTSINIPWPFKRKN